MSTSNCAIADYLTLKTFCLRITQYNLTLKTFCLRITQYNLTLKTFCLRIKLKCTRVRERWLRKSNLRRGRSRFQKWRREFDSELKTVTWMGCATETSGGKRMCLISNVPSVLSPMQFPFSCSITHASLFTLLTLMNNVNPHQLRVNPELCK